MSVGWNWKSNSNPINETVINKTPNPNTGTSPPLVVQGALYEGPSTSTKIYLYGGTTSPINISAETYNIPGPSQYPLWSMDVETLQWNQYDINSASGAKLVTTPSAGAWTEAPDQGLGFYLSGKMDNASFYTDTLGPFDSITLPGMAVLNFTTDSPTALNISTSGLSGGEARLRGGMQYLPHYGDKGLLTVIGGGSASANDNTTWGSLVRVPTSFCTVVDKRRCLWKQSTYLTSLPSAQQVKQVGINRILLDKLQSLELTFAL
jgi:hypothetical protein